MPPKVTRFLPCDSKPRVPGAVVIGDPSTYTAEFIAASQARAAAAQVAESTRLQSVQAAPPQSAPTPTPRFVTEDDVFYGRRAPPAPGAAAPMAGAHGKRPREDDDVGDASQSDEDGWLRDGCDSDGDFPGPAPGAAPEAPRSGSVKREAAAKESTPGGSTEPKHTLSGQQLLAVEAVRAGRSVFITGGAGTGKSAVLRAIIGSFPAGDVAATASTGMAAVNIQGGTIHRASGLGLVHANDTPESVVRRVRASKTAKKWWESVRVVVLDEISMLDSLFFDSLSEVGKHFRRSQRPFGGVQMVLCGDFMQLPPVTRGNPIVKPYCFDSRAWRELDPELICLQRVFRQRSADPLTGWLRSLRYGKVPVAAELHWASMECQGGALADSVQLRPRNQEVLDVNRRCFDALPGPSHTCRASEWIKPGVPDTAVASLRGGLPVEEVLHLKLDTRVMLRRNMPAGLKLVNGSGGVVKGFVDPAKADLESFKEEERMILRKMVAEGRLTALPLVQFNGREGEALMVILPHSFEGHCSKGEVLIRRMQLPLSQAWAFSIHKSQGMSLDFVDVDLGGSFSSGQAYVAVSRARSLAGLRVRGLRPGCFQACEQAAAYDRKVREATHAREAHAQAHPVTKELRRLKAVPKGVHVGMLATSCVATDDAYADP